MTLPPSPLPELHTVELHANDAPLLQRFFDANPFYFESVNGEPAQPGEALEEIQGELPAGWPYTKKWVFGYADQRGELAAMANVVTDLLAPGVWHIGTFIVATERHGRGDAQVLYRGLEAWARDNGARWLRLGVVEGHARAQRFWSSCGFERMRARPGMQMGKRVNTVVVMVKFLAARDVGDVDAYLAIVPRDRPDVA